MPNTALSTSPLPKILVIDDSALIRKAVAKVLGTEFEVLTAVDGLQGLQVLKTQRSIQLVITDLSMPNIDGYGVIKAIRGSKSEALKHLPIIVITGNNDANTIKLQALDLGANDFLTKPFTSADLLARSRSYVQYRAEVKTLKKQAARDPLSGLITRKPFDIQLAKDISRVTRHKETLAVMLVELQDAKSLLDELGEARSDSLIKMITQVLGKSIRKEDTLARLNTAIFAISLPSAHPVGVKDLAQRIFTALNATRIKNKGKNITISVAVGVCAIDIGCCPPIETIYKDVKAALAEARARKSEPMFIRQITKSSKRSDDPLPPHLPNNPVVVPAPAKTAKVLPRLSIDKLLDTIASGETSLASGDIDSVIKHLKPLVQLMTTDQKKLLLK